MAMWGRALAAKHAILTGLLCAAMLVILAPSMAFGAGFGNLTYETFLTVYSQYDGKAVSGSKIDVYHVANIGPDGAPDPTDEFSSYNVLWDISSSNSQQALANALEGYALRDNVTPTYSALTDASGAATFPANEGGGIAGGWYLILVERSAEEDGILEAQPTFFNVSEGESEEATLKMRLISCSGPSGGRLTIDASKVWIGDESKRPESVNIQLLRDGKIYQTVQLRQENGWHYAWKNLPPIHRWTVMEEEVPENYRVSVVKDGDFVTLVNTYAPEDEGGKLPDAGGDKDTNKDKLPQTGGMWWPVIILLAIGTVFFCIGLLQGSRR